MGILSKLLTLFVSLLGTFSCFHALAFFPPPLPFLGGHKNGLPLGSGLGEDPLQVPSQESGYISHCDPH